MTNCSMGNLLGFQGWVNATTLTPFNWHEYDYIWKSERRYHDFHPGNSDNSSCEYPRMWGQDGFPLTKNIIDQMDGCKESEFDLVLYNLCILSESIELIVFSTEISKALEPTLPI